MMILVVFFSIYKNKEVARCFHGYRNYAPHSDIIRYQNLCPIPSSSRICIQIPLAYPALPNPLSRPLFPFCLSTIMCYHRPFLHSLQGKHLNIKGPIKTIFYIPSGPYLSRLPLPKKYYIIYVCAKTVLECFNKSFSLLSQL